MSINNLTNKTMKTTFKPFLVTESNDHKIIVKSLEYVCAYSFSNGKPIYSGKEALFVTLIHIERNPLQPQIIERTLSSMEFHPYLTFHRKNAFAKLREGIANNTIVPTACSIRSQQDLENHLSDNAF